MSLLLDDMREEFARFLATDPAGPFRMDAALAHVITLAYMAGMAEGAAASQRLDFHAWEKQQRGT